MDRQAAVDGDGHELLVILADEDSAAVAELLPAWHLMAQDPATVPDGALHQREAAGTRRIVRWSVELRHLRGDEARVVVTCSRGGRSGYVVEQAVRLVSGNWRVLDQHVIMTF
jgi:hypothetical protein